MCVFVFTELWLGKLDLSYLLPYTNYIATTYSIEHSNTDIVYRSTNYDTAYIILICVASPPPSEHSSHRNAPKVDRNRYFDAIKTQASPRL